MKFMLKFVYFCAKVIRVYFDRMLILLKDIANIYEMNYCVYNSFIISILLSRSDFKSFLKPNLFISFFYPRI